MSDVSTFGSVKQLVDPIVDHSSTAGSEQRALARVLAYAFAVDRLRALASASSNASALPTLVLWIDAGASLPAPVVWLALVTWPVCVGMAMACIACASHYRRRCAAALPAARRLARVSFASAAPPASAIFAALAAASSALIWLDAVAPPLVAAEPLAFVRTVWAVLIAATLRARYHELSA
jgi:hypothetical protein